MSNRTAETCDKCKGSGVVPIGDGYSVNPCPNPACTCPADHADLARRGYTACQRCGCTLSSKQRSLLRELDEYLSRSPAEAVHAGSILHQKIKGALQDETDERFIEGREYLMRGRAPLREALSDIAKLKDWPADERSVHFALWRSSQSCRCGAYVEKSTFVKITAPDGSLHYPDKPCTAVKAKGSPMTDAQIKHMVNRFLGWRLPENFCPDAGISFKPTHSERGPAGPQKYEPTGTNLFDASQAEAMVRYMVDGMPAENGSEP